MRKQNPVPVALAVAGVVAAATAGTIAHHVLHSRRARPKAKPGAPDACKTVGEGTLHGIDFIELVTGGAEEAEELPMVIVLHGLGHDKEYTARFFDAWEKPVRVILPDGFYKRKQGGRTWWRGYHPKGLQAFMAEAIPEASDKLEAFVRDVQECFDTLDLPVIAGHSMGGYIALDFANSHPELIRGAAPSAAWRPVALWDREPEVPVYAVHGKHDTGVPYERSKAYYDQMAERGREVELTTIPTAHKLTKKLASHWRPQIERLLP